MHVVFKNDRDGASGRSETAMPKTVVTNEQLPKRTSGYHMGPSQTEAERSERCNGRFQGQSQFLFPLGVSVVTACATDNSYRKAGREIRRRFGMVT